ncbi:hypothetical protein RJ640_030806 [Escallonia rubra]|uniref:Uncharacterized protein n=1 Tax=Escallonia rubra TaxID=112253 RepID=A0AA88UWB5_9ASTE|nr:hypothetical protein RJ640_030806 [Escallonia rubra]
MTVFSNAGGGYPAGKQVFPVDYEAVVSQRLVDASHADDLKSALDCISDPFVNVNFIGAVCLNAKRTEIVLHDESANEVRVEFEEFKTEVTALFLAAHAGNVTLVKKLLSVGANVNQKLFRGYATTAAVREGHVGILEILLIGGAGQSACEEALLEASYMGQATSAKLLMGSEMIRQHVAVHALVTASSRGSVDVVDTLIKCGVDTNSTARVLLRSSKPSLHANVDCNALVAATVSRQVPVVRLLLQLLSDIITLRHLQEDSARRDAKVRLGAWSWDMATGEEFRVGAGLAEPYSVTWCAVEYFEASGSILRMLLQDLSSNIPHLGRTIIHHAILCGNARAVNVLLNCGADVEFPVETTKRIEYRPIHMAARLGFAKVLQHLISAGCNLNSKTEAGETALMICTRYKRVDCFKLLASAGADFGLVNVADQCVKSIAGSMRWTRGFRQAVLDLIRAGKVAHSSNSAVFSPLLFVTRANDIETLKKLMEQPEIDLDEQDKDGFSAVMVAAAAGHVEAFQLLVYAGADVNLHTKYRETAVSLSEASLNSDAFGKVLLEYARTKGNHCSGGIYALHRAARRGDLDSVRLYLNGGYDVNFPDRDGYTPLMLAARDGHGSICELLISCGARCDIQTANQETALRLARKNGSGNDAERVILDELARTLVLGGACVKKHRKKGKGAPSRKLLKMVGGAGVLKWGKSSKRNVICRGAEVGPSSAFRWNRRKKFDADEPGVFRVITTKNKEFHFVCEGGIEMAQLWVRGIQLVTREAIFGRKTGDA